MVIPQQTQEINQNEDFKDIALLWQEKNIINFDKDAALIITFSFVVKKKYAERWMYG